MDWLENAGFYLMQQTIPRGSIIGAYVMRIKVPIKCPIDLTNIGKAPEDLLVNIGVLPDDKWAYKVSTERSYKVDDGDCHVSVRGIKTGAA